MKKVYKIAAACLAVILVGCILLGVFNNRIVAEARATLPGVESIVGSNSNSNSYDILEVVASKSDARIGYLVGGEEPVRDGKSLKDMLTKEYRTESMDAYSAAGISDLITAGALSYTAGYAESDTGANTLELRGLVYDAAGGEYTVLDTAATYKPYVASEWTEGAQPTRYSEYVDWSFGNSYAITIKEAQTLSDKQIVYTDGNTYGIYDAYNISSSEAVSNYSNDDLKNHVGRRVYVVDMVNNVYTYYGRVVLVDAVDDLGNPILDGGGNNVQVARVRLADASGTLVEGEHLGYDYLFVDFEMNRGGAYVLSGYTPIANGNGGFDLYKHWEVNNDSGTHVIDSASYSTLTYVGAGNGNKAYTADTMYSTVETVKYDNGFTNAEWLKKNTFDISSGRESSFVINVTTVTMEEFNNLNVSKYDMVILTAGSYSTDMGTAQAQSLIKETLGKKMPTVLEVGFDSDPSNYPNIHKVATVLRQNNLSSSLADNAIANWTINDYWSGAASGLESRVREVSADNYAYVKNSVLVYDNVDTGTHFVNANFLTAVSDSLKSWGFADAVEELRNENFYRDRLGLGLINDTINMATALRYVVNYSSQRVIIKSSITVLEIEPCYSFLDVYSVGSGNSNDLKKVYYPSQSTTVTVQNLTHEILSKEYIANNWATQFASNNSQITLVQTYTREFIGKIEDLNENYDMIYVGLDTTTMNTELEYTTAWNGRRTYTKKTNKTVYNDSNMNGLIYTHIGDLVNYGSSNKLTWNSTSNNVAGYNSSFTDNKYRLSGNDITEEKLEDLKGYIKAGYPVVFHDNFFTYNAAHTIAQGVNTAVIDSSSNMYKLAQFALAYTDRNVFFDSQITASSPETDENAVKNRLSTYLNLSKLSVSMTSVPTQYVASDASPAYLSKVNGEYYLIYEFALKNDAVYDTAGTTYDVQLYIDSSVDGRFSSDEEIPSLSVYEQSGAEWKLIHMDETGHYRMLAGRNYRIERIVPNGYVGVLPWKLVFTQNNGTLANSLVRVSQSGYTAIPVPSSIRQQIKVLQITTSTTSGTYAANYLDLTSDDVKRQFALVQDFDIQVTKISAAEYFAQANPTTDSDTSGYLSYLNQYDMLVLGFSDCYEMYFTGSNSHKNPAASTAIQQYISSGKSILFTHDTTSFNNKNASVEWGYYFNKYVRGVVGMDRFNVLGNSTVFDSAYTAKSAQSTKDRHIQGYSDGTILGNNSSASLYRTTCRYAQYNVRGGQYTGSNYVTKVNDGQITNYPFYIPDTFKVASTHYQYYQLNLDTNSKDDNPNDDIVVWYCISDIDGATYDDLYQATPNDVRNNYYIYNMGNVTYSGVGHSTVKTSGTEANLYEIRLFVNTMVAAYKTGKHPPKVTYKSSGNSSAATIETKGVLFDEALNSGNGQFLEDKVSVYFEITDTSFVQGERMLSTEYYVECSASEKDATDSINGKTVNLKLVTPSVYKINADGTETKIDSSKIKLLDTDTRYRLELDTSNLMGTAGAGGATTYKKDSVTIYVMAATTYKKVDGTQDGDPVYGYYPMTFYRIGLFDLE